MNPIRFLALAFAMCAASHAADGPLLSIGVARIDITPNEPIRLHGYGNRRSNSVGVAQHLFAKALALGTDREGASVLFTVDNLAVPSAVTDEVAARLKKRMGIKREQIALCSSHTHSAPVLSNVAPNIFSMDIVPAEQAAIDRYTTELVDNLERVGLAALSNRAPSRLSWSEGTVMFAKNRRVIRDGRAQFGDNDTAPVDHALATMFVHGADGKLRAVLVNYACHNTTLGGDRNLVHGDWSGCAQEAIERDQPGAIALVSIGCGGDANPSPRGTPELARAHGEEIATEVRRLLNIDAKPLTKLPRGTVKRFQLDFDPLPTRAQWEERATKPGIVGYHAKKNLARLDRGEKLPTKLPYVVQSWTFDDQLAMVFLAGEVVVDYEKRLKREFDGSRLWVNGYANDVPCYIPSRRILNEGGYEAEDSLWYYDRPARLAMSSEDRIIDAVHEVVPKSFLAKPNRAEGSEPLSPRQALNSIRVAPEFIVDLVAAEPLVVDPVAIDWGADGKLWVAEMRDYPMGIDGKWKPGGVVKFLEDTDGDGHYDKVTELLGGLPFPTGVFAWRNGVLICAAPDIIYAEDTNGDGHADVVKKIFTGFETNNYQARVNSLSLGLDGWIYGANGLLGGKIERRETALPLSPQRGEGWRNQRAGGETKASDGATPHPNPLPVEERGNQSTGVLDIRGRDFRMNPDTGAFEPASGLTQQGRVRDDFGNWFGCDNSHLLWHYPLADEYVRRNPHAAAPKPALQVPRGADWNRLFPASRTLERFNDPNSANRVTSACGLEIYRDELLGKEFYGNAFTCEPVHNLVHREVLMPDGVTFRSTRATNELNREFFASTDNWCRPVQVRTGPDGALWIVDMYRYVIEHPRWIPSNRLAQLDVRAGADKGRIYRVYRKDAPPRRIQKFAKLSTPELAAALDSSNGTERDIIHRELLNRGDVSATNALFRLATNAARPAVQLQALSILGSFRALTPEFLAQRLSNPAPEVRRCALRLAEPMNISATTLSAGTRDPDPRVRYQAALSLANLRDFEESFAPLLSEAMTNAALRSAILTAPRVGRLVDVADHLPASTGQVTLIESLLSALNYQSARDLVPVMQSVLPHDQATAQGWRFRAGAKLLERYAADESLRDARTALGPPIDLDLWEIQALHSVSHAKQFARAVLTNTAAATSLRRTAAIFLGRCSNSDDVRLLGRLLDDAELQQAALDALVHATAVPPEKDPDSAVVAKTLLDHWPRYSPRQREQVVERCLANGQTADALLKAVENHHISLNEISVSARNRLLGFPVPGIRQASQKLFPPRESNRGRIVAEYRQALIGPGSSERGAEVFNHNCSSCHQLHGRGAPVGPDLAPLRDKSAEDFLLAILDPNAAIEPRFVNYTVQTRNGNTFMGVVRSETATSVELAAPGIHETLLRSDIASIQALPTSLMPEGLEQNITPGQMSDLIAFLRQPAPRLFGSATREQMDSARKEFMSISPLGRVLMLQASEQLDYPSWMGRLPLWHCRQTDGKSHLLWQCPPSDPSNALPEFVVPVALGFVSQPAGKFTLKVNGRPAIDFDVTLDDTEWTSADGKVLLVYRIREANSEDSNGLLYIRLVPELVKKDSPVTFEVIGSAANSQRWFGVYDTKAIARPATESARAR